MKHGFTIATAALSFSLASPPAMAGDIVQIIQRDTDNTALIEQSASGGGNVLKLEQGYGNSVSHLDRAHLVQHAVTNSVIDVIQYHYNSDVNVFQHDGANMEVLINHEARGGNTESNLITIDQSGHGVRAVVEQGGSIHGVADIIQQGWGAGNAAEIHQTGEFNLATIYQAGSGLSATIRQGGDPYAWPQDTRNTATIRQGY